MVSLFAPSRLASRICLAAQFAVRIEWPPSAPGEAGRRVFHVARGFRLRIRVAACHHSKTHTTPHRSGPSGGSPAVPSIPYGIRTINHSAAVSKGGFRDFAKRLRPRK